MDTSNTRRMLINAAHSEDTRIAIIEGKELVELEIDSSHITNTLKGNIYKTVINRVEPSLQAAFIDIGTRKNAFLQINDVHPTYYKDQSYRKKRFEKIPIQKVLEPGQEIIVQVVKDERGEKGATLTTYLSLPGRYIVLMPGTDNSGISKRIKNPEQRDRIAKINKELEMPAGMGMIVRTAGMDRSITELSRDLETQLKLWENILEKSQEQKTPHLLYEETDTSIRVIRDYFTPEIREILIDNKQTHDAVKSFVEKVMPRYRSRVKLFEKEQPIFTHFNIDNQVNDTMSPEVKLKSGGSIVIDTLEALVAIDVNSGKATAGEGIEDTAYRINLEAADEVARQLRLRDLGGLIVIDFIDMLSPRHKSAVEKKLKDAIKIDRARIELGSLSKFGLMEMSRQRLRSSLIHKNTSNCPTCNGSGFIKGSSVVAMEALRKVQSAIVVGNIRQVKVMMATGPALFLLNNKKSELTELEKEYGAKIFILASSTLRPDDMQFEME